MKCVITLVSFHSRQDLLSQMQMIDDEVEEEADAEGA